MGTTKTLAQAIKELEAKLDEHLLVVRESQLILLRGFWGRLNWLFLGK